jgi:hypothetical protein
MILNNGGALRIYSSLEQQHRFKSYAYGASAPITINRNQVPPFQVVYPIDAANVNSVVLISRETGAEVDVFTEMEFAGLKTVTFPGYKILKWRASTVIPGPLMAEGMYYLKIGNGVYFWYSEDFVMKNNVSALWKIEYCHGEDFPLPEIGHIDYTEGFKNYFYVCTEVGKPAYGYEEEVKRRDGVNLPLQQIRFKSHRFALILPEEVIDAMSLIPLHDTVIISRGEVEYEVDEITMGVEWQEQGDLAVCEFEFRTDSVVVVNGRGLDGEVDCAAEAGSCYDHVPGIAEVTEAVAYIEEGSAEWDGPYYITPGGAFVDIEDGDAVMVLRRTAPYTDQLWLMQYNTMGGFSEIPTDPGEYIYEFNTGRYFFQNGATKADTVTNRILDVDGNDITFQHVPTGVIEFFALVGVSGVELIGAVLPSFAEETFTAVIPPGTRAVRMVVSTPSCPAIYTSSWFYLDPLELVSCAGDYASDAEALADGVLPGQMYCLTAGNIYGLPVAVVKQLEPFAGYPSSMAALIVLGYNVVFPVSVANEMGLPGGVLRINVDGLATYDDDTAAASGGVAVGEFYIRNYIDAGFPPYLITKRLA